MRILPLSKYANMTRLTNFIPRIDEVVKFVASRITRFCDPAGFLFPRDPYGLSNQEVNRLIGGFIPGPVEVSGWGDLLVDHHQEGYRIYASVDASMVFDIYCDINLIDQKTDEWAIHLAESEYSWIYHEVAHFVPHTYMDSWSDRILREVPANIEYVFRNARKHHSYV